MSALSMFQMWMDDHEMRIIEADGVSCFALCLNLVVV